MRIPRNRLYLLLCVSLALALVSTYWAGENAFWFAHAYPTLLVLIAPGFVIASLVATKGIAFLIVAFGVQYSYYLLLAYFATLIVTRAKRERKSGAM